MNYVLSDIHGHSRRFASVLNQIRLQREDTLYVLGDVIDRHPDGIAILRQIMAMPNAKMLLGNHEYMMLRALGTPYDDNLDDGGALAHWYRNGGEVTHDAWVQLPKEIRWEITDYLRSLPLNLDIKVGNTEYKLVHGAPVEAYEKGSKYRGPVHFTVWHRLSDEDPAPENQTLIFGHTPTRYYADLTPMEIWYGEGRIGIDCGCGHPDDDPRGRLACLRLEDGAVFYSE